MALSESIGSRRQPLLLSLEWRIEYSSVPLVFRALEHLFLFPTFLCFDPGLTGRPPVLRDEWHRCGSTFCVSNNSALTNLSLHKVPGETRTAPASAPSGPTATADRGTPTRKRMLLFCPPTVIISWCGKHGRTTCLTVRDQPASHHKQCQTFPSPPAPTLDRQPKQSMPNQLP